MDRCLNVVKLLMVERGVEAPGEKERVREGIRAHLAACADCAAIYEELTAPVDEAAVEAWRALFATSSSAAGAAPEPAGVERGPDGCDEPVSVFIDDAELRVPRRRSSGAELMALAAIPPDAGLIRVQDDGSQELIGLQEAVELRPGDRFRRAPRFARG